MLQLVNNINYLFHLKIVQDDLPQVFDQTNCCDTTSDSIMVTIHFNIYYIKK